MVKAKLGVFSLTHLLQTQSLVLKLNFHFNLLKNFTMMKKKLSTLLALLLMVTFASKAQLIVVGLKGGVNLSQLSLGSNFSTNVQESLKTQTGYVAGVYARVGKLLFIQPELLVSAKGGSVDVLKSGTPTSVNIQYTNIDVPVLIGYKFGLLRINAGPIASFNVSSSNELATQFGSIIGSSGNNVGDTFKSAAWGYQAGGGVDIGSLSLDVRYEGSLSNVTALSATGLTFSQKASVWQVTLGLRIL